jgi:hypothetical protein
LLIGGSHRKAGQDVIGDRVEDLPVAIETGNAYIEEGIEHLPLIGMGREVVFIGGQVADPEFNEPLADSLTYLAADLPESAPAIVEPGKRPLQKRNTFMIGHSYHRNYEGIATLKTAASANRESDASLLVYLMVNAYP